MLEVQATVDPFEAVAADTAAQFLSPEEEMADQFPAVKMQMSEYWEGLGIGFGDGGETTEDEENYV